jgi:hypothetical protein
MLNWPVRQFHFSVDERIKIISEIIAIMEIRDEEST